MPRPLTLPQDTVLIDMVLKDQTNFNPRSAIPIMVNTYFPMAQPFTDANSQTEWYPRHHPIAAPGISAPFMATNHLGSPLMPFLHPQHLSPRLLVHIHSESHTLQTFTRYLLFYTEL